MATVGERVKAIVEKAQAEGRTALSALFDVVMNSGRSDAQEIGEAAGKWIEKNGEPTFEKLLSWGAGHDTGKKDSDAAKWIEGPPAVMDVEPGEKYGLIRLEHRQTGQVSLILWTDRELEAAQEEADAVMEEDPRIGAWLYSRVELRLKHCECPAV